MPFDIAGWSEAAPGTGLQGVTAGAGDRQYRPNGDGFKPKSYAQLGDVPVSYILGVFAAAESTGEEIRLSQAGLVPDYYQFNKIQLLADLDPTQGWTHLFSRPLPVFAGKYLNGYIQNATDEDVIIGVMLGDRPITFNSLDQVGYATQVLHGIGDTTLTANTWTECTITWDQELAPGRYAIVGMRVFNWITAGTMSCLARVILPDVPYRPGVPCGIAEADHEEFQSVTYMPFANWYLDEQLSFMDDDLPNIECLSPAALTDQNVELVLKKIS